MVKIRRRANFTGDGYATAITADLSDSSPFYNQTYPSPLVWEGKIRAPSPRLSP